MAIGLSPELTITASSRNAMWQNPTFNADYCRWYLLGYPVDGGRCITLCRNPYRWTKAPPRKSTRTASPNASLFRPNLI
jgi:hypothetical protein